MQDRNGSAVCYIQSIKIDMVVLCYIQSIKIDMVVLCVTFRVLKLITSISNCSFYRSFFPPFLILVCSLTMRVLR